MFKPESRDKYDGMRIAKLTKWRPHRSQYPYLDCVDFDSDEQIEDKIDFLFNGHVFSLKQANKIYISVYNAHLERGPVTFTIKLRD